MYTKRENEIVTLLLLGKTNKSIAEELGITMHTVKAHIEHIYEKNNIHSRVELVVIELTKALVKNHEKE